MEKTLKDYSIPIFDNTGKFVKDNYISIVWSDDKLLERVTEYGEGAPVITETVIKDPAMLATETQAETDAGAIPNWATWSAQQAVDHINTNVTDLASAKVVLVAMARMIVALRNKSFPRLGD